MISVTEQHHRTFYYAVLSCIFITSCCSKIIYTSKSSRSILLCFILALKLRVRRLLFTILLYVEIVGGLKRLFANINNYRLYIHIFMLDALQGRLREPSGICIFADLFCFLHIHYSPHIHTLVAGCIPLSDKTR